MAFLMHIWTNYNLSQRQAVRHEVHPLVDRVGLTEVGDGEGEGGEHQVDGVDQGEDQEQAVECSLVL